MTQLRYRSRLEQVVEDWQSIPAIVAHRQFGFQLWEARRPHPSAKSCT